MDVDPALLAQLAHAASSFAAYERTVLGHLARSFDVPIAFFVRGDGIGASTVGLRSDIVARPSRAARWAAYGDELSPVFADAARRDGVSVDRAVLGDALRSTRVFREIIQPHEGRCTMLGTLAIAGERLGTVALGSTGRDFGPADRERLAALLPTLALCEGALQRRRETSAVLTAREQEVVRALRLGYTNGEIAVSLGTSVNTVRNQLRSVFAKLGATTRAEAVAISLGHGV